MSSLAATSLSGMSAAQAALGAAAHNIANLATPGFRREQVQQTAAAGQGGVLSERSQAQQPRQAIEADMVDQLQAKNAFLANLAVFKTGDSLLGALLDTRG